MNFKRTILLTAIVSGGLFLGACNKTSTSNVSTGPTSTKPTGEETVKESAVITYNGSTFSPATLNVEKNQKIIFKNDSSVEVAVYSNDHPTHKLFPELNIGSIEAKQLKTLLLTKPGIYTYHNHLNSSQKGTIIVK